MAEESTSADPTPPVGRRRRATAALAAAGAGLVIVVVAIVIVIRVAGAAPSVPTGVTAVENLQLGACLAEDAPDLGEYTVVDCTADHRQEVFAPLDLAERAALYSTTEALGIFADALCSRFLDYGLYVRDTATRADHRASAIDLPTQAELDAGETTAWCVLRHQDGSTLTEPLYEPLP